MKTIKKVFAVLLTVMMALSSLQLNVFATSTFAFSLSTTGDGKVTVIDSSNNEYVATENNQVTQDFIENESLTLKIEADESIKKITLNGQEVQGLEENTQVVSYTYKMAVETNMSVDFSKKQEEVKQEQPAQTEQSQTSSEEKHEEASPSKEEAKEKTTSDEKKEETKLDDNLSSKLPENQVNMSLQERVENSFNSWKNKVRVDAPALQDQTKISLGVKLARTINQENWLMYATQTTDSSVTLNGQIGNWLDVKNPTTNEVKAVFSLQSSKENTNANAIYTKGALSDNVSADAVLKIERIVYEYYKLQEQYTYPETLDIYFATQNLIWDTLSEDTLEGNDSTSRYQDGNVDKYEQILKDNVSYWYIRPSFQLDDGSQLPQEFKKGEIYTLKDTSGAISHWDIWTASEGINILEMDKTNSRITIEVTKDIEDGEKEGLTFKRVDDSLITTTQNTVLHSGVDSEAYVSTLDNLTENADYFLTFKKVSYIEASKEESNSNTSSTKNKTDSSTSQPDEKQKDSSTKEENNPETNEFYYDEIDEDGNVDLTAEMWAEMNRNTENATAIMNQSLNNKWLRTGVDLTGWTMGTSVVTAYPCTLTGHSDAWWIYADSPAGQRLRVYCLQSDLHFSSGYKLAIRGENQKLDNIMPHASAIYIERIEIENRKLQGIHPHPQSVGVQFAAQNLIWDELARVGMYGNGYSVRYTGNTISKYEDELKKAVNKWYQDANFVNDNDEAVPTTLKPGDSFTLKDANKVIGGCEIYGSDGVEFLGNDMDNGRIGIKVKDDFKGDSITVTFSRIKKENVDTGGNYVFHSGKSEHQILAVLDACEENKEYSVTIKVAQNGTLDLQKESANKDITDNNNCYSLEGAVYGVYSDSTAKTEVGTLTTKADGTTNKLTLKAGTYYVKEKTAPKGYALDTKTYTVTVTSSSNYTLKVKDRPQTDPVGVLLGKIDATTNANKPQGSASLANAYFTVKFYKGEYGNNIDPATKGATPTRTWVMKTDSDGWAELSDTYKISGDAFYYTTKGEVTLPVGQITIQETKAPDGYKINNEVFVVKITPSGTADNIFTYNEPTVKEQVVKFNIVKKQTGTNALVPNTTFNITYPDGNVYSHTTDKNGSISLVGIKAGKYTVKESKTIDGLQINPNSFSFEILADGSVKSLTDTANKGFEFSIDSTKDGNLTVYDETSPYKLKVNKINDKNMILEGAEFTLYKDQDCTQAIETKTTGTDGTLIFENLKVSTTYYLKETKAPEGYRIPVDSKGNVHVYEIKAESTPSSGKFDFTVDNSKYTASSTNTNNAVHLEGSQADRIISVQVINYITGRLPETGSSSMIYVLAFTGVLVVVGAIATYKKKKDSKKDK